MKAYNLNPLEQLQLEKSQLQEECKIAEKRMAFQARYLSDNWGGMLKRSITSSIKSKLLGMVGKTPIESSHVTPYVSKPKAKGFSRIFSSNYKSMAASTWGLAKPLLWSLLTKKATTMIFGKKKKKRRKRGR